MEQSSVKRASQETELMRSAIPTKFPLVSLNVNVVSTSGPTGPTILAPSDKVERSVATIKAAFVAAEKKNAKQIAVTLNIYLFIFGPQMINSQTSSIKLRQDIHSATVNSGLLQFIQPIINVLQNHYCIFKLTE